VLRRDALGVDEKRGACCPVVRGRPGSVRSWAGRAARAWLESITARDLDGENVQVEDAVEAA
jgi:hypothetical protein